MFFVVDVETQHTVPSVGNLLSFGAYAVTSNGEIQDHFYVRLAYEPPKADLKTIEWWNTIEGKAHEEAFSWELSREHPFSAALRFAKWVREMSGDESAFFVANPASFDYPWIDSLFNSTGVPNPFSHRTLCLRSMRFGIEGGEFGLSRGDSFKPDVPHHALYDAKTEAEDLVRLLELQMKEENNG